MFGFGKQKKETYQELPQEDYFYDDYEEGYEEDYGYEPYPEESYGQTETYSDYDQGERRTRRRTAAPMEERYDYSDEPERPPRQREEAPGIEQESALQQEVARLEETVAQLKQQLEVKQTEMSNLVSALTEKEQALADQVKISEQERIEAKQQINQLQDQLQKNQTNQSEALTQAQLRIEELERAQADNETMKEELATILVETKKQERAILERAEFEAKGIRSQAEQEAHQVIHDASLELRVMKQEIKNYRKRLRAVQEETTQFFVRLLANSDTLLEDE